MAQTIFDIGMFDGADTAYYLEEGYRVVAVEANPELVHKAAEQFAAQITAGQLDIINAAISEAAGPVELTLSKDDPASSSIIPQELRGHSISGTINVEAIRLDDLIGRYGVPFYMKVDIEGADRLCILALRPETSPDFLSFEIGDDVVELIAHLQTIGYGRFKIVSQTSFRELANQECLEDRIRRKLLHWLGFRNPSHIRRAGRFFRIGSSSGPVPWRGDGRWYGASEARARMQGARERDQMRGWHDIHAARQRD